MGKKPSQSRSESTVRSGTQVDSKVDSELQVRSGSPRAGSARPARVAGIDVARGLAALLMLQGHATDAWVPVEHQDAAYGISRLLGTLPLPAFLFLAGASVTWRVSEGRRRGDSPSLLRRLLVRRGLTLVATGYAVSLAFAFMDGMPSLSTLLRADVLHVIGLSIATAGLLVGSDPRHFVWRALGLGVALTLICPLLPSLGALPLPLATVAGLFLDAPPITRMPLIPLFAWFAAGTAVARVMHKEARETPFAQVAGAPPRTLFLLAVTSGIAVALGYLAMVGLHEALGGELSRRHLAIWGNVVDLAGRASLVLVLGAAMSPFLPRVARRTLVVLGQGSLVAYVFHLPFCYGRLGARWRDSLTMTQAVVGIVLLSAVSYVAVWVWPRLKRIAVRATTRRVGRERGI